MVGEQFLQFFPSTTSLQLPPSPGTYAAATRNKEICVRQVYRSACSPGAGRSYASERLRLDETTFHVTNGLARGANYARRLSADSDSFHGRVARSLFCLTDSCHRFAIYHFKLIAED